MPKIDSESMLQRVVHHHEPAVIYVYSPMCPHCINGFPKYADAVLGIKDHRRFYRYDGLGQESLEVFKKVTGTQIKYYPMIIGISKNGLLVEFNDGPVSSETMETFLKALDKT